MQRNRKKINRIQTLIILSLALFGTVIAVGVFGEEGVMTVYRFRDELKLLKQDNDALVQANEGLKKEIQSLKTEPLSVEMIAREKLHMVKPGEVVYQIVPQPSEP